MSASQIFDNLVHFFSNLFVSSDFNPRNTCGPGWTKALEFTHMYSDALIFVAYLSIPLMMSLALLSVEEFKERRLAVNFTLFILACGLTHAVDSLMFLYPLCRLSAFLKVITAIVSVKTVWRLSSELPRLLRMKSEVEVEQEIARRFNQVEESLGGKEFVEELVFSDLLKAIQEAKEDAND